MVFPRVRFKQGGNQKLTPLEGRLEVLPER